MHRSNLHIYAQVIDPTAARCWRGRRHSRPRCADDEQRRQRQGGGVVGKRIAEKAKKLGIETVAFDRSGFKYHGRVKALADAAREAGLKF